VKPKDDEGEGPEVRCVTLKYGVRRKGGFELEQAEEWAASNSDGVKRTQYQEGK